jgi:hypothetical protein
MITGNVDLKPPGSCYLSVLPPLTALFSQSAQGSVPATKEIRPEEFTYEDGEGSVKFPLSI